MAELDTSGLESYENSEDILIQRQKRERKDLQSQIQKLKHGIPKGDKKKKKEVTDQIKQLEAELNKKHRQELQDLKNSQAESAEVTDKLAALDADLGEKTPNAAEENRVDAKPKKLSKAQKRRDKKSAREKEREDQIKQQESNNLLGPRHVETQKIKAILEQRGLQIYEIASDGNCLYNAISHQLIKHNIKSSNESLREQTSDFMKAHTDDFLPFLTKPDTGDPYNLEEYNEYCNEIATTSAWGGQLEVPPPCFWLRRTL